MGTLNSFRLKMMLWHLEVAFQPMTPQDFDVIEGVYTCDSSSIEEKKRIASIESTDKLQNLQQRKHVIKGDPETWSISLGIRR